MNEAAPTCSVCGRTRDEAESLLTWSRDTDSDGRRTAVCPTCTRAHVRGIEAKLDERWW